MGKEGKFWCRRKAEKFGKTDMTGDCKSRVRIHGDTSEAFNIVKY